MLQNLVPKSKDELFIIPSKVRQTYINISVQTLSIDKGSSIKHVRKIF